jgi:Tol biopolymer transport system component/tRNA A-37 threonylcarbamoyl transferase component Bud32
MPELLSRLQSALVGRYRLDGEIGAGGMATVYVAQDLRHDRRVALKVLRPELAAVIGAERFLAEIKLTANLQHPHILPLFDSGEADSYLFYVMPFVEGETLRDRLTREKQLPVPDALRIAGEVASALDYAHRRGVVHRDIKPENILVHEGQALVADFGIALAASKASGARMTETGMSLGTPHYMSPEQAMGEREITPRSDVYALGAVLYEMLTGEPPFTGNTAQAVVARVLTESPRPLGTQRHTIPRHVEAAVLTALEKLPADRFASAAEFADALKDKSYASTVALEAAPAPARAKSAHARKASMVTLALAGSTVLAAIAALWGWLRPAPAQPLTQFGVAFRADEALQPVANQGGSRLAISPDGRMIAYLGPGEAGPRLWLRRLDQLTATPIPGTETGSSPFFSPDGRKVGFFRQGTSVRVASLDGAPTVTLYDKANSTAGDWGDDGYVYFEVDSGLARIHPGGGSIEQVYTFSKERNEVGSEWPFVLPGSHGLIFRSRRSGQGPGDFDIMVMKLPKGPAHALIRGIYARYSPTGHLLVVTADGKLIAVPFDPDKLEMTGSPVALLEGVGVRVGGFNVDLSLSKTGTLIYTTGSTLGSRRPFWVSRDGQATAMDANWDPQGLILSSALSPDGKALAIELSRDGKSDIWVKQLPTGPFSRITFGDTASVRPGWSPDGREVYYVSDRQGTGVGAIYARKADGTGTARQVILSKRDFGQSVPSRDGRWLVTRTPGNSEGNGDILAFRPGDSTEVPLVATQAAELFPSLSPDGRWLAYQSNESGTFEVYVRPFPETGSAKWQVSTAGGSEPKWSTTGRELFYINGKGDMVSAQVRPGATFFVSEQHNLFSTGAFAAGGGIHSYSLSPDGRRFVFVREGEAAQQSEMVVAQHWLQAVVAKTGK